jgi:hypothetical protein
VDLREQQEIGASSVVAVVVDVVAAAIVAFENNLL